MEEILIRAKQANFVLGKAAADAVSIAQIDAGLTVKAKICGFFAAQNNFHLGGIWNDERTVR